VSTSPVQIATPFSNLFADADQRRRITSASDLLEIRHPAQAAEVQGPVLYHCELSLVSPWNGPAHQQLATVARELSSRGGNLKGVSFHVASRYAANMVRDGAFEGQGQPMDSKAMLSTAVRNANLARRIFPDVPVMVENNNHLGTDAYDVVTDPEFIAELTVVADAGFLLDIPHARITAANTGLSEDAYFSALPLDRAWQIHLSRHGYRDGRATDAHEMLEDEDWEYLVAIVARIVNLRFATIEYYRDADRLLAQIEYLRLALGTDHS
jgi:uncharacterized protein DUF692